VVFLTICSYYAYTRHYRTVSGNAASSPVDSAALQESTDPQALLSSADHFYWLNNGPAATPLYARAAVFSHRSRHFEQAQIRNTSQQTGLNQQPLWTPGEDE
jgi:hypothetical protein